MELLGATPMLLVFFFLTMPALVRGLKGTALGRALMFIVIAAMLNAMFFLYVVSMFSGKA